MPGGSFPVILPDMKTSILLAGCLSVLVLVPQSRAAGDAFTPLFDGRTLAGWRNPYGWGTAEVADGEIRLSAERKFFLVTERPYTNFVLEAEVRLPDGPANSGFMFRAHVETNRVTGYQAEVDGDENRGWSGGLYDEGGRMWFVSPIRDNEESVRAFRARLGSAFKRNDWNAYRITCDGPKIRIEVNGVTATDIVDDKDASGFIGIQHHGEKGAIYRFRNLRVRELP